MRRAIGRISRVGLIAALLAAGGCGGGEPDGKGSIPMSQLPAPVVKAAQSRLKDAALESAVMERAGGEVTYEVKGRDRKGQEQAVRVSREGKVLDAK